MSNISADSSKIFEPSFQSSYWSSLDPDLRIFLDDFEMRESWTYDYNELPGLFTDIAKALPKIANINTDEHSENILNELYPILASMPFRLCITAISWLDRNVSDQSEYGWGVVVFMEAARISEKQDKSPFTLSARMVYERIRIILVTRLAIKIFTNIPKK